MRESIRSDPIKTAAKYIYSIHTLQEHKIRIQYAYTQLQEILTTSDQYLYAHYLLVLITTTLDKRRKTHLNINLICCKNTFPIY